MDQQPKIIIKDLNFYYNKKQAIKNLSLDISKNEILAIFGPANSGITTLLRTLNRLSDLTYGARHEGDVLLDGENIYAPDINVTELRRRVGMVFDVPAPLPMSIFDNVAFGPRMSSLINKKSDLSDKVEQSLRMAALWDDVKDRLDTPAMRLSGGQQQRLCIARVLALEPEVILLDRPCSALDPVSTAKIEDSLKRLSEQFTIVIAPHNVQQATRIADNVAFMLMGDLIEHGDAFEVLSNPKDKRTSDYITGRFG
ncbi:MAG TPA: phosphate ABC transporter ATP-binding protein [Sedimentibacter sp.]|nr:phosphate ABC transporter ATP-binding protein [Sedimentibacter sp.]HOH69727.1 phosphate ABC transporter ATP-binding protein [Sedimentibacter sp.]